MTLCARTQLDDLEASVPDAFRDDFEWLKATVVQLRELCARRAGSRTETGDRDRGQGCRRRLVGSEFDCHGGVLTETLREAIASSERFVLIASKASAANQYVQLELRAALEMEKPIIIVCPDKEICPEWRSKLGDLRTEGRLAGPVHCSGDGVEPCGPALVAALTRNRGERLAGLAGRPSSFWPD